MTWRRAGDLNCPACPNGRLGHGRERMLVPARGRPTGTRWCSSNHRGRPGRVVFDGHSRRQSNQGRARGGALAAVRGEHGDRTIDPREGRLGARATLPPVNGGRQRRARRWPSRPSCTSPTFRSTAAAGGKEGRRCRRGPAQTRARGLRGLRTGLHDYVTKNGSSAWGSACGRGIDSASPR